MKLTELLEQTGDFVQAYPKHLETSTKQVFPSEESRKLYFRLSDYVVSSAVSGPSLIMVERELK